MAHLYLSIINIFWFLGSRKLRWKVHVLYTAPCLWRWRLFEVLFHCLNNFRATAGFFFHNLCENYLWGLEWIDTEPINVPPDIVLILFFPHWLLTEAKINCLVGNANTEIQGSIDLKCAQRNFPRYWHHGGRYNPCLWRDNKQQCFLKQR